MTTEQTRAVADVFDDWADRGRAEGMEEGHLRTAAGVLEGMDVTADDVLLDLGTGNGWAVRHALARGARGVGVDVATRMLKRAADRTDPAGEFVQASFEALPFADAVFTQAFSMEALYYASDLDQALDEAARVLRPGGNIHVLVDRYTENEASHEWSEQLGVDMHLLSEAEWANALAEAGFRDVTTRRVRASDPGADEWKRTEGSLYVTDQRA